MQSRDLEDFVDFLTTHLEAEGYKDAGIYLENNANKYVSKWLYYEMHEEEGNAAV